MADAVADGLSVGVGVSLGTGVAVGGAGVSVAVGGTEDGVELGPAVGGGTLGTTDAVAVGVCDGAMLVTVAEGDGSVGLDVDDGVAEGLRVAVAVGVMTTTGGT